MLREHAPSHAEDVFQAFYYLQPNPLPFQSFFSPASRAASDRGSESAGFAAVRGGSSGAVAAAAGLEAATEDFGLTTATPGCTTAVETEEVGAAGLPVVVAAGCSFLAAVLVATGFGLTASSCSSSSSSSESSASSSSSESSWACFLPLLVPAALRPLGA
jgi:hypothetical protein